MKKLACLARKKGLFEAVGGWARILKGWQINEESNLSWMTLRRTENRLLVNLLSFQGIAGSVTQPSKDQVSHLGSH